MTGIKRVTPINPTHRGEIDVYIDASSRKLPPLAVMGVEPVELLAVLVPLDRVKLQKKMSAECMILEVFFLFIFYF